MNQEAKKAKGDGGGGGGGRGRGEERGGGVEAVKALGSNYWDSIGQTQTKDTEKTSGRQTKDKQKTNVERKGNYI